MKANSDFVIVKCGCPFCSGIWLCLWGRSTWPVKSISQVLYEVVVLFRGARRCQAVGGCPDQGCSCDIEAFACPSKRILAQVGAKQG